MKPDKNQQPGSVKVLSIASIASLSVIAMCSLYIFIESSKNITAENQYDNFLLTIGVFFMLVIAVVMCLVLFVVCALVATIATSKKSKTTHWVLSGLNLLASGYYILGYTIGTVFLASTPLELWKTPSE